MVEVIQGCQYPSVSATLISSLKDEINGAWPAGKDEKTKTTTSSPFLEKVALDCVLGPLHKMENLQEACAKKEYLEANSEVVLASVNALRFVVLREQRDMRYLMLDKDQAARVSKATLPGVKVCVRSMLADRKQTRAPTRMMLMTGCVARPAPSESGDLEEGWESQILMNLLAIDSVLNRLEEIIETYC